MGLFLPFADNGKATELLAIEVKGRIGVGPYDFVDPWKVVGRISARLLERQEIELLPEDIYANLFETNVNAWSAVGLGKSPITAEEIIMLNFRHHEHRQKVSLMEEVIHIARCHPRVPLRFDRHGKWIRPYDRDSEDEAYNVGAACVIPYRWLFNHIKAGSSIAELADQLVVSQEYVKYRIKRAGLWYMYRKRQRNTVPG